MTFISEAIEKAKTSAVKPVSLQSERPQQDVAETLKKFAELRDAGIITEEEFEEKKKNILGTM